MAKINLGLRVKTTLNKLLPQSRWRLPLVIFYGVLAGLLMTIVVISNAASYLSDNPRTCVNCHIMTPQYATWAHSSHRERATCNDCHVPHNNFLRKYMFKASDGLRHATMFTLRLEPQVIHIKEAGKGAVQENCIRCHKNMLSKVSILNVNINNYKHGEGKLCWECHRETPHGRVLSNASTPYARVPALSPVIPDWMMKFFNMK